MERFRKVNGVDLRGMRLSFPTVIQVNGCVLTAKLADIGSVAAGVLYTLMMKVNWADGLKLVFALNFSQSQYLVVLCWVISF